ncbi:MAG TPA: 4-alpha-glucanotransferase [Chitinophagaceae bacterium]|nr:4-alpha-glucanotransferase [Chitinophagaceae bacterium]
MATEKLNTEQGTVEVTGNGTLNGNHVSTEKTTKTRKTRKPADANISEESGTPADKPKTPKAKKAAAEATGKKAAAKKTTSKKAAPKKGAPKKQKVADGEAVSTAPVAEKPSRKKTASVTAEITFQLKFHTKFGQTLHITGNHEIFGNKDLARALPMKYLNNELWTVTINIDRSTIPAEGITYNYFIRYEDGIVSFDWGADKVLLPGIVKTTEVFIADAWNFAGYFENAFYTEPFKQVLLKNNYTEIKTKAAKNTTHIFKVKAPLLSKGETLCITGSGNELGNWNAAKTILLARQPEEDFFSVKLDLSDAVLPIMYKYAVYDIEKSAITEYEGGNNRMLFNGSAKNRQTIVNDGFAILPNNTWKGAGVAVPVFSLRTNNSCGVGEFADINLLVDWAKKTGLKLIQVLPVNDTTATHTWTDSYPYAAISAFALHPMYLHLENVVHEKNKHLLQGLEAEKEKLNNLDSVDYEAVNALKWSILHQVYPLQKIALFASDDYQQFFKQNEHWLVPYAAFCYLRDKHKTADFNKWPEYKKYDAAAIKSLLDLASPAYDDIAIYFFVQYHLHVQLKEAAQYAHNNGVIVKGDIPIGVYRNGADAWQNPELYHMDMQAGAPPDDFAVKGQNWSFPTYNWDKMRESEFAWWKQRFEQMSYYFDAFRIDHVLGFFRIWSIPVHSVEGIMGHFEPAIPVYRVEFDEKGIWFDQNRYCKPYITDKVLGDVFGDQQGYVKETFLNYNGFGNYSLKAAFDTQRKVEEYFADEENTSHNQWLKQALFDIISNVILFEVEGSEGKLFHFRFGAEGTSSFKNLEGGTQQQLRELYVNYFFRRQDEFWKQKALQTLPELKRVTNMLVCGEDLGLVPACVPDVMRQLGLLSLEIQRMPKDSTRSFFHPADAPYLAVVTPSTHDMSTIRGWWEEDRNKTQQFYNYELGQWGNAPYFCEAWINKAIVAQHLYSPAMWSIFQVQDILGTDKDIRRPDPHEERINVPAIPKYYWRYRMHITLEKLLEADEFNIGLYNSIKASGRV